VPPALDADHERGRDGEAEGGAGDDPQSASDLLKALDGGADVPLEFEGDFVARAADRRGWARFFPCDILRHRLFPSFSYGVES
jgi:hypothetical protein